MEEILYWLIGGVGMPLISWLKGILKVEGKWAMLLTVVVSVVMACAALFISGDWSLEMFTWVNVASVFGQMLAAATLAYKLLLKEKK